MARVRSAEFDMLRQSVAENARRIEELDQLGTRGVGVIQTQLTELTSDVTALAVKFERHESDHVTDQRDRRTARRWLVATGIAFLAMVEAPLGILLAHIRY